MKILIIYRHYWPDATSYAWILKAVAERLARDGHEVTVYAAQPSYNDLGLPPRPADETVGGVRVVRRALPPERKTRLWTRVRGTVLFLGGALAFALRMARIDLVLRDHRANEICSMDPKLIDILHSIQQRTIGSTAKPVEVVSAYRSPTTNSDMRRYKRGVARNSFHTVGQAVDIRVPGFSTRDVYKAALGLKEGGIGYYGRAGFVHLDTGNYRTW